MAISPEMFTQQNIASENPLRAGEVRRSTPLLPPSNAWRILQRRTGGHVSRSTFYRWLDSGKVYSLRLGSRIYIPWDALQDLIGRCLGGDPL